MRIVYTCLPIAAWLFGAYCVYAGVMAVFFGGEGPSPETAWAAIGLVNFIAARQWWEDR